MTLNNMISLPIHFSLIFTLGEGRQAIETNEPECEWDHMLTPLSKYKNQPFAVGSFLEYGQNTKKPNRAEMFDLTTRTVFKKLTRFKFISKKKILKSPFLEFILKYGTYNSVSIFILCL